MNQLLILGGANTFVQFLTALLVFVLVLALTYFTAKWVGTYQKIQPSNRNFEVIETCKISNNKFLQIVKIGQRYFLIGIGKDEVNYFTELKADELDLSPAPNMQDSFQLLLKKAKEKINHKRDQDHE